MVKEPKVLLSEVVALIQRDIEEIKKVAGKLEHYSALDLVSYSRALVSIVEQQEIERKTEKDRLSKLSLEQLQALAKTILSSEKSTTMIESKSEKQETAEKAKT